MFIISLFFFNWRIIAFQCCVGFSRTTALISFKCVCMCVCVFSSFPLSVSLMVVYVGQCCSQFVLPCPSPPCPQVHSLHLCLYFCPANRFTSAIFPNSISSFPSPRIPPSICSHGELRFPPSFSLFHSVLSSATRIISPKTSVDFF